MKLIKNFNKIKSYLSWATAFSIIVYLVLRVDVEKFTGSLYKSNFNYFLPLMIIFIAVWFMIESFNLLRLFKNFGHEATLKSSMHIRGITYLLLVVNYNLGIAGTVYYIKKKIEVPFKRAGSLTLFYLFTETMALSGLVIVSFLPDGNNLESLNFIFIICGGIFFAYTVAVLFLRYTHIKAIEWILKKISVLEIFREAGIRSIFELLFIRALYFSTFVIFFYFSLKAFSINIPFLSLAIYIPIIFYIGTIPITPFGIGTIQAAMIFFFNDYSNEADILAYSLSYTTCLIFLRLPIGMYYFWKERGIEREQEEPTSALRTDET